MKPTATLAAVVVALTASPVSSADKKSSAGIEFFEKKIRPVLVAKCYKCHAGNQLKGGLRVDTRDGIRRGGESGPAVVPKNTQKSLILEALRHESFEMPPKEKLSKRVIADFVTWIKLGAPDPRKEKAGKVLPIKKTDIDFKQARRFWSFTPPQLHKAPPVKNRSWSRTGIDPFVLAKLEKNGLAPNPRADARTLIRRATYALTGLPPTAKEVDAFVRASKSDPKQAYAKLIDRLLNSPHYGERWARMWLDVSRYAEDQAHIVGSNSSLFYPNAYLYRDWVIKSLNADMPYDKFLRLQLAADLYTPQDQTDDVALGFIGLGPKYYRRNAPEVMADEWEDRVDTVSRGLLGLTVACARCHDHKYDPIPTTDYYGLAGVFAGTQMYNRPLKKPAKTQAVKKKAKKKSRRRKNSPANSLHIIRDGQPRDLNVYIRGNHKTKGPLVKRRFLTILSPGKPIALTDGSGRKPLAEAIVDSKNPLTARVIVNRVWAVHFGKGIVSTPSNFGQLGSRPTHPRLLDDLAVRFMKNGWSLKWLHREILLSSAWQQSSDLVPRNVAADPDNKLLWRANRRRLGVEAWRDTLLAASGRLDRTVGGKSIDPQKPDSVRRTVYARISRLKLNAMLVMFDHPDPNAHAAKRVETTTSLQKLFVLNSPFMVKQAEELAKRIQAADSTTAGRIDFAYRRLFGRVPSDDEARLAKTFVESATSKSAWEQYSQVLLASNELLFVD